jgi:hypothetical protein
LICFGHVTLKRWQLGCVTSHGAVVSRDCAGAFAEAIAKGAPSASQVTDCWHLLNNLLETLIGLLEHHRGTVREVRDSLGALKSQMSASHDSEDTLAKALQRKQQNKERRLDQGSSIDLDQAADIWPC